jgi:hypothetical protein
MLDKQVPERAKNSERQEPFKKFTIVSDHEKIDLLRPYVSGQRIYLLHGSLVGTSPAGAWEGSKILEPAEAINVSL